MSNGIINDGGRDSIKLDPPLQNISRGTEFEGYCYDEEFGPEPGVDEDHSLSTQVAIPFAHEPMDEHFAKRIAVMKEVIFERVKLSNATDSKISQNVKKTSEGNVRVIYYADGGPGAPLMMLWINRAGDKNIQQGHRREAFEIVWDLTRDGCLFALLMARGAVRAIFCILEDFLYEPPCKAQKGGVREIEQGFEKVQISEGASASPSSTTTSSKDCLTVVEDMSLSCFVEQEEMRAFALLALLNLIKFDPQQQGGGVGEVLNKLTSDDMVSLRRKLVCLCHRYLESGRCESSYWNYSHIEGAAAAALKPENLTQASYELVHSVLTAMQRKDMSAKHGPEMREMEQMLQKHEASERNRKENTIGSKRSFIKSTRISIC